MKMLYVYNNKKRKTPLIKTPYSKEAEELYKSKGWTVSLHDILSVACPKQAELMKKEMKKNDSRTLD